MKETMEKETAVKSEGKKSGLNKLKKVLFGEKNIIATLILTAIIVAGVLSSYFACDKIARERGLDQFEDAVNSVVDQVNSKFERDGEILKSMNCALRFRN